MNQKNFYKKVLEPLGYNLVMEIMDFAGFGIGGEFRISEEDKPVSPIYIAFLAETRQQADEFYKAAIDASAQDNGAPGIRAIYHPDYYGAFVIGPDRHNIEAVCHNPE